MVLQHSPTWARTAPKLLRQRSNRYSTFSPSSSDTVTIPCKANGSITLDIHVPLIAPPSPTGPSGVLIYLPRGPILCDPTQDVANINTLRQTLPYNIVNINYRLSSSHPYPTPIHDVLTGFDWVIRNLIHHHAVHRQGRSDRVGRVAVCGELLGGSLAIMLALTECRAGQVAVVAAAVNNAFVDWPSLDDGPVAGEPRDRSSLRRYGSFHPGLSASDLLGRRNILFRKPEQYFDPFASPLLFFRTPGGDVPPPPKRDIADDLTRLSLLDREDFHRQQLGLANMSGGWTAHSETEVADEKPSKGKTSHRFPGKYSRLKLPSMHISTGSTSALRDQSTELAALMRKSVARISGTSPEASEFGRKVLTEEEEVQSDLEERHDMDVRKQQADNKIQLHVNEGLGLWNTQSMSGVAKWLQDSVQ